MDVREKLIELLYNLPTPELVIGRRAGKKLITAGFIADHLIANGVTVQENVEISDELLKQLKNAPITICKEEPSIELVQEWISVKDRLPEEDGTYLTALNHHFGAHQGVSIRKFAKDGETVDEYELAGQKYVWYFYDSEYGYVPTDSVTHWMPLPEPPKGE